MNISNFMVIETTGRFDPNGNVGSAEHDHAQAVNKAIKEGWHPFGPSIPTGVVQGRVQIYAQTMVKYSDSNGTDKA